MIAVVDLGIGNLANVRKALGGVVTSDPSELRKADKIVLPGVGNFGAVMRKLEPLRDVILDAIDSGKPFLGICLGMQLLFEWSEESEGEGLRVLRGNVIRIRRGRVPHIGWNQVHLIRECPLFEGVRSGSHFYFVHSYHVNPEDPEVVVGLTDHEGYLFPSAIWKDNVFAVQFHPEKSSRNGLKVMENFRRL